MRKATTLATTSAAPREGGAALDLWERLTAPFDPAEVRSRRGPRGDLRYITAWIEGLHHERFRQVSQAIDVLRGALAEYRRDVGMRDVAGGID